MNTRKHLVSKLKRLHQEKRIIPKKYQSNSKTVAIMPSPIQKKDFTDYKYGLDIDKKVIDTATKLAERMAVAIVRETLHYDIDSIIDKICDNIISRLNNAINTNFSKQTLVPVQREDIKSEAKKEIKDFVFDKPELAIDRSQGIRIKGDIGKKTMSTENTDADLEALDKLF